ncbi:conjugal transfer protein [Streptomyces ficellus]|uniref:Conjugal transfer protein n=1 Tax=Streptomyces ficellus TaxID=1977088 RepID=A0ABT7Z560_9ACTN|nr:conjugal transfer protein [Streptomyces ficellus]MDN3294637.1 conjugal transfer protein [Streptomyces ficellus]
MGALPKAIRVILNLPEPRQQQTESRAPSEQGGTVQPGPAGGASAPGQVNPWVEAARRLEPADGPAVRGRGEGGPAARGTGGAGGRKGSEGDSGVPWNVHEETSGARFARRFGRGLLWTVVVLAAITGVRSWFFPDKPPPAPAPVVQAPPRYAEAQAQAVASRFARAYLTWSEDAVAQRESALSLDLAPGVDVRLGWDGKGAQRVEELYAGTVTVLKDGRARVRVEALVSGGAAPKAKAPARWIGLDVPVVQVGERIVVTGAPGTVALGRPSAPPAWEAPESDAEMSTRTKSVVDQFFRQYATGDPSAVAAPGVRIPPLPKGYGLVSVNSWAVDFAKGDDRTGTAVVTWSTSGGTVSQTYRVSITRVASAEAGRWQVSGLHGGAY